MIQIAPSILSADINELGKQENPREIIIKMKEIASRYNNS